MAFFRKWKTHYKHKKFTSDDNVDAETWPVSGSGGSAGVGNKRRSANRLNRNKKNDEMKTELNFYNDSDNDDYNNYDGDGDDDDDKLLATFDIKYLGCTPIESKRSEKITSEAIKTVIATSKAAKGSQKAKNRRRIKLTIDAKTGIHVIDQTTQDTLMNFSIFKIFYCSVDASNDHIFCFVSSVEDNNPSTMNNLSDNNKEKLLCHVFDCLKRKTAHEITLMVARCFEKAYRQWRDSVVIEPGKQQSNMLKIDKNDEYKNSMMNNNGGGTATTKTTTITITPIERPQKQLPLKVENLIQHQQQQNDNNNVDFLTDNLLLDLNVPADNSVSIGSNNVRNYLQNTWVYFENDAPQHDNNTIIHPSLKAY